LKKILILRVIKFLWDSHLSCFISLNNYKIQYFNTVFYDTYFIKKTLSLFKMQMQFLAISCDFHFHNNQFYAHSSTPFCSYASGSCVHPGLLSLPWINFTSSRYWSVGLSSFRQPSAAQIVSNVHRTVIADVTHASHGVVVAAQALRLNKSVLERSDNSDKKLRDRKNIFYKVIVKRE